MAETTPTASISPRPKRYKPWFNLSPGNLPVPAVVSILHRMSGAGLFLFLVLLLVLLDRSLASQEWFDWTRRFLAHPLAKLVMTGLAWAYLHHFCAGVRYLLLDLQIGIDLQPARRSSFVVLAVSLVLTLLLGAKFIW